MRRGVPSVFCVSVCLSFCKCSNFRKPWPRTFIFGRQVRLWGIHVKFVYEDHRVKVQVTRAEKRVRVPQVFAIRNRWILTVAELHVCTQCGVGYITIQCDDGDGPTDLAWRTYIADWGSADLAKKRVCVSCSVVVYKEYSDLEIYRKIQISVRT